MGNMLATGAVFLAAQQKAFVSQVITYKRGSQSVSILATPATEILRVSDGMGNTKIERPDADWIFAAADLNFGQGVVEPATGDVIQSAYGSVNKQFEVMPAAPGEPSWRYCDPTQIQVRVHSKFIA